MGVGAMLVCEIMNGSSPICTEDMLLGDVYGLMEEHGQDYVTVVDSLAHKIPIGIISVHGICAQILRRGRNPRGMTAANVMSADYVKTDRWLYVEECRELIDIKEAETVIVVDDSGSFQGSLTRAELDAAARRNAGSQSAMSVDASAGVDARNNDDRPFHIVQGGGNQICWHEIL